MEKLVKSDETSLVVTSLVRDLKSIRCHADTKERKKRGKQFVRKNTKKKRFRVRVGVVK